MKEFFASSNTLFAPEDSWVVLAIIVLITALAVWMEKNTKIGAKLTASVICIFTGIIFSGFKIVPTTSGIYTALATYCIPLAVCMMLFNANVKEIFKKSGKMIISFHVGVVATLISSVVGCLVLTLVTDKPAQIMAGLIGGMIGSTPNIVAIFNSIGFDDDTIFASMLVIANVLFAIIMTLCMYLSSNEKLKKYFPHPHEDEVLALTTSEIEVKEDADSKKGINLVDMAVTMAIALAIVAVSSKVATLLGTMFAPAEGASVAAQLPSLIFGNQYVIISVITCALVTAFPDFFAKINGAQEIGAFLIFLYFTTIGMGASIFGVLITMPQMLLILLIPYGLYMVIHLMLGKLLHQNIEDLMIAAIAGHGGPMTASGGAASKGYKKLIVPALMVGIWGNIIATVCGTIMYAVFVEIV